jgi:hypothetical protein
MTGFYDPIVAEVRKTRQDLLEKYGGTEGYNKHLDEMEPKWKAQGWHYETQEEFSARVAGRNTSQTYK